MDTTDTYFYPGDEELEVWVVPPAHEIKKMGYIKGHIQNESGIMRLGTIKDHAAGSAGWSEDVVQQMAEKMMDQGFIFFFLRVITTTNMVAEPNWKSLAHVVAESKPPMGMMTDEQKMRYEDIAREHDYMAEISEDRVKGAGDYDRGMAEGVRLVLRGD